MNVSVKINIFFTFILLNTVYGSTFFLSSDCNKKERLMQKSCHSRGTDSFHTHAAQKLHHAFFLKVNKFTNSSHSVIRDSL